MALDVFCFHCKKPLQLQGALLFSPPYYEGGVQVTKKLHICVDCYPFLRVIK